MKSAVDNVPRRMTVINEHRPVDKAGYSIKRIMADMYHLLLRKEAHLCQLYPEGNGKNENEVKSTCTDDDYNRYQW